MSNITPGMTLSLRCLANPEGPRFLARWPDRRWHCWSCCHQRPAVLGDEMGGCR
jgi:hypothetical protein